MYLATIQRKQEEKQEISCNVHPHYYHHNTIIFIRFMYGKETTYYQSVQIKGIKVIQCGLGDIHAIAEVYVIQVVMSCNLSAVVI